MRNLERSIFLTSTLNDGAVGADTTASGSEFQMRTTLHVKKWFPRRMNRKRTDLDLKDLLSN